MKTRFPWLARRRKTDPELPIEPPLWMGTRSNGEYFHFQTPYEKKLRQFVLEQADANARRVGVDRRTFLASALGMATTLWSINVFSGCTERGISEGSSAICVPPEAMFDEDVACSVIGGDEFIFDVQTHWFNEEDTTRFPQSIQDIFGVLFILANENAYVREMFLNSQTSMAVLTSWPGTTCSDDPANTDPCGLPLSNEAMARSRETINALACNTQRVVQHVQVLPNDNLGIEKQLDIMTQFHCEQRAYGWKMYPGFSARNIDPRGPTGYFLTDPQARQVIEHGLALGVNRFAVHKGLPILYFFEAEHNHPRDVGVVAKEYPEANFIIYHSAICAGSDSCNQAPPEGPYDPDDPDPKGVNALIRSLLDNGIEANQNVYAEIGSAINEIQNNPMEAAHFFGKLMKYVGTDRVVWGTDCVIYGSPQQYIEWFRTLTIPEALQEQYGYPPLDATNKAKIFGRSSAALYDIDIDAKRCEIDSCETAQLKRRLDEEYGPRRWAFQRPGGPKTWQEYVDNSKLCAARGRPG
jgi:predicted TIM-barrel fold metal-dependent hydrolase